MLDKQNKLVPAVTVKDAIEGEFAKRVYDTEMFFYQGYPYAHQFSEIRLCDDYFQWAYLDDAGHPTGYFAYHINVASDCVNNFGLYSFKKNNISFINCVYDHIEKLAMTHHRLEWRAIGGNPVIRNYLKFCISHNGCFYRFHDVVKDANGDWHDEYVFEIVKSS